MELVEYPADNTTHTPGKKNEGRSIRRGKIYKTGAEGEFKKI